MGLILKQHVTYGTDLELKDLPLHEIESCFRRCLSIDTNPTYPMTLPHVHIPGAWQARANDFCVE